MSQNLLRGRHFLEGQALSSVWLHKAAGKEVPIFAFFGIEGEKGFFLFLLIKRFEEPIGCRGHVCGRIVGVNASYKKEGGEDNGEYAFHNL